MASGNNKLIIVDYYDSLIQLVDIYTEEKFRIYSNEYLIVIREEEKEEEHKFKRLNENFASLSLEKMNNEFLPDTVKRKPLSEYAIKINFPQKTPFEMKAQDYLNFMRDELINQIEKVKKETLDYYETIKDELKDVEKLREENLKRKLFANRFAFLFLRPYSNLNPFTLNLVISDFYLNESQLEISK